MRGMSDQMTHPSASSFLVLRNKSKEMEIQTQREHAKIKKEPFLEEFCIVK